MILLSMNLILIGLVIFFGLVAWRLLAQQKEQWIRADEQLKRYEQLLSQQYKEQLQQQDTLREGLNRQIQDFNQQVNTELKTYREKFDHHQLTTLKLLQESIQRNVEGLNNTISQNLQYHTQTVNQRMEKLTEQTDLRLKEISGQVDRRLAEGFEKTNATFHDVIKRLALIDEAQKKITELSSNVVSLQEVLANRGARGVFGETQLEIIVKDVLAPQHFALQYTLSNQKRADCVLFLPEPTGNLVIDAKFPLENYQRLHHPELSEQDKRACLHAFRQDMRRHIQDVASKYIIPGETADGAILFIPAEAIFADLHCYHPEIVAEAQRARVWLTSPTTLMAVLTTASAVLKDAATRKQVHLIQEHLRYLAKDFGRFQERMDKLAKHIAQAHQDVAEVNTSAQKISARFDKIEQVELQQLEQIN